MKWVLSAAIAGALSAHVAAACAEDYPSRPVRLVVPYSAGGPSDTNARFLARGLTKYLGQTVLIDNVAGAGGNLGAGKVASSPPDGYTLLHFNNIAMTATPAFVALPGYDPINDFTPIGLTSLSAGVILGRLGLPPNDLVQLTRYLKEKSGNVNFANSGVGSPSHVCHLLFLNTLQTTATSIPYRGGALAMNDLIAGQTDLLCDAAETAAGPIKSGRVKAYGVTSGKRATILPDVPTMDEQGLTDFEVIFWFAMFAPKGTPEPVVARLLAALQETLRDPDYTASLNRAGIENIPPDLLGPAVLGGMMQREIGKWRGVIAKAGIGTK